MAGRKLRLNGCALLVLLAGPGLAAALEVAPVAAPVAAPPGRGELPPLARVEGRLAVYGEKLARWRELAGQTASPALTARRPAEWPACYAAVENLARAYGLLREEVVSPGAPSGGPPSWQVFADDLDFVEGGCGQVLQQVSVLAEQPAPAARTVVSSPAEPGPQPLPPLGEQEQLDKWNRALGLFDSGNYDEAISEFGGLLHTPRAAAARDKIREAGGIVAGQLRRQAAGVFLKARKTEDLAQKKKLLEESWSLLNKIVTAYPEVEIIDKVKQNQTLIEEQLHQLDPALLQRLKAGAAG